MASTGIGGSRAPARRGDPVVLRGEGLQPGSLASIYLLSTPRLVGQVAVGADGGLNVNFAVPSLPDGKHTVQLNTTLGSGVAVSIGVGVEVAGEVSNSAGTEHWIVFKKNSSKVSKAGRQQLQKALTVSKSQSEKLVVVLFTNARKSKKSQMRIERRVESIKVALNKLGNRRPVQIQIGRAPTKASINRVAIYDPGMTSTDAKSLLRLAKVSEKQRMKSLRQFRMGLM